MGVYLYSDNVSSLDENEKIVCQVCNKVMPEDSELEDFNYAWDGDVEVDCCNECFDEASFKYVVWVGAVDDYYTTYKRAKEHYDEWIEKGYDQVVLETMEECLARSEEC